jgi:hypothetical protein
MCSSWCNDNLLGEDVNLPGIGPRLPRWEDRPPELWYRLPWFWVLFPSHRNCYFSSSCVAICQRYSVSSVWSWSKYCPSGRFASAASVICIDGIAFLFKTWNVFQSYFIITMKLFYLLIASDMDVYVFFCPFSDYFHSYSWKCCCYFCHHHYHHNLNYINCLFCIWFIY